MGDHDNNRNSLATFSVLAVILAAFGITFFTQSPFKSARPPVPKFPEPAKVSARLWQDPFEAVLDHVKTFKQLSSAHMACFSLYTGCRSASTGESDPLQIEDKMKQMKLDRVTVLGVMVSGKRFAEDVEKRTRYRYAVLAGLRRLGFVPEDTEHINYVAVSTPFDSEQGFVSFSNVMPYEWLRNSPEKDAVLLLWINDDVFRENHPLCCLNCLAGWLGRQEWLSKKRNVGFKIIGPTQSDTLKEMLDEADKTNEGTFDALKDVSIYSALATADNSLLLEAINENQLREYEAEQAVTKIFKKHQINFTRTIRTDRELAQMLVNELTRRNFSIDNTRDCIVLVSEWDTFYGRSQNDIYRRILIEMNVPGVESRVRSISYLRGIDGALPGEKEERKDEKADAKPETVANLRKLEEPIGRSQYDYLRRLTQVTYHVSREKKGSIKAIGVLGTDFYDKYLVLQAFHERFPQAIFFTTDMDARFLHPDALKWTRNLIIASNFDLSLRNDEKRDLQGDVPPFRDNYQTSLFFATLWAFKSDGYNNPLIDMLRQRCVKRIREIVHPQLFEVGRYSAVKLSQDADDINPRRQNTERIVHVLIGIVAIILILVILLFLISSSMNTLIKRTILAAKKHWLTAAGILAALIGVNMFFYKSVILNPNEEPMSLFEGVSIWPTEALRLVAVLFAVGFIIRSRRKLIKNYNDIKKSFGLSQPGDADLYEPDETGKHFFERLKILGRNWNNYIFHCKAEGKWKSLDDLWRDYIRHDSFEHRVLRLIPVIVVYLILTSCVIVLSERPISPLRGEISSWTNIIMLFVTVILYTFLVFYVFDVISICRRFIDIASERITELEWSEDLINKVTAMDKSIKAGPEIKEWVLIQLVAKRTDAVGKLIFYPFIVWFIMFISRINLFDNWPTPVGLAIVLTISVILAWSCAFLLRRSAEAARAGAVRRLKEDLGSMYFHGRPDEERIRRIEFALKEVTEIRAGAFAPFMQHPVVQALFVPFGGVGGVYLIDFFSKLNI